MNRIKNSLVAFAGEIQIPHLRRLVFSTLFFAILYLGALTASHAETVNFESFAGMPNLQGTTVPSASRLSNQLTSIGVTFNSGSSVGYVAIVNLGVGHATSGTNGIGGVNANGALLYTVPIWITFVLPSDPSQMAVTDSVSIHGDRIPASNPGTITLEAFDLNGLFLGSDTKTDTVGTTLSFSMPGIHSVRIRQSQNNVAFDDLSFNTLTAAPAAVSEPTTMLLAGTGLMGIAGAAIHKRRKSRRGEESGGAVEA